MDLSNCKIDNVKTCNNDNIGMKSAFFIFLMISLIFSIFINIHEYANYANMITCIFDHGMKGRYLSFNSVEILVYLWLKAAEILFILYVYPNS